MADLTTIDANMATAVTAVANTYADTKKTEAISASGTNAATAILAATPIGAVWPYAGITAPTGFLFCYGQPVSRTTYSALFTALSTTYGAGDGSTTFNLPDLRGRTLAGKDNMGGTAASRLTSVVTGSTLGAAGGTETHTLDSTQIPAHNHTATTTGTDGTHSHTAVGAATVATGTNVATASGTAASPNTATNSGAHGHTISVGNTGGGLSHPNVQPTFILNYIIKAL